MYLVYGHDVQGRKPENPKWFPPRWDGQTQTWSSAINFYSTTHKQWEPNAGKANDGRVISTGVDEGTEELYLMQRGVDNGEWVLARPRLAGPQPTPQEAHHHGIPASFPCGSLLSTSAPKIRTTYPLDLQVPREAGRGYITALTLSSITPGVPVGRRLVPAVPDTLLFLTAGKVLPAVLVSFVGALESAGTATAKVVIPSAPGLLGVNVDGVFVIFGWGGLGAGEPGQAWGALRGRDRGDEGATEAVWRAFEGYEALACAASTRGLRTSAAGAATAGIGLSGRRPEGLQAGPPP